MTPQPSEQPPIDVEQFWRDRCQACAHPKHPLDECHQIVGGTFEPDYCPCAVELPYIAAELRRLAAAPDPVASPLGPCIFDDCVSRDRHWHGGFPGGYTDPADPEGPPIPFTAEPEPGVRDYNGAVLGPVASPAPLDVERLAQALIAFDANGWKGVPNYGNTDLHSEAEDYRLEAEWVAAEYARLTGSPDPAP